MYRMSIKHGKNMIKIIIKMTKINSIIITMKISITIIIIEAEEITEVGEEEVMEEAEEVCKIN